MSVDTPTVLPAVHPLATIRRRVAGYLIDFALVALLLAVVWAFEAPDGLWGMPYPTAQNVAAPTLFALLLVVVPALAGRTVGMWVLDMRIRSADDRTTVGFWRLVLRGVLTYVDMLLLGLVAVVSMLSTEKRQRLGDLAARTVVERTAA